MIRKTILIADDEVNMRILIHDFLCSKGYEVICASDGQEAVDIFEKNPQISLVILDVMMPVMNGWKACESIKEESDVPVIILTARCDEKDELYSFNRGADEYVKKPFSLVILLARIEALLKQSLKRGKDYKKGCLIIQPGKHCALVNNKEISLSKYEFEILYFLVSNEGRVVSREQIIENIWGFSYDGTNRTVDTHMTRMKNKLGSAKKYIKSVRGYGYKFEAIE
jgi:DNA-binding response OmpR family regulator